MSGDAHESQRGQAAAPEASADVFISYASQDKAVADAVCKALESAGVACWIAPRDVTPGEFYAESIVHAIDSAKVLVLVLSQNAAVSQHVLREVERASSKRHPVVSFRTDLAPLPAGLEYFLNTSQWLDASATGVDRALPRLVDAVKSALAQPPAVARVNPDPAVTTRASPRPSRMLVALAVIVAIVLAYVVVDKFWLSKRVDEQQPVAEATPAISDKSIAVLPFVDMSEKKDQDYFSDGISEELLNLLAKIPELRVIARTSSFAYKGKEIDIAEIAKKLNVAHVLEGSVRKSGNKLRITAQLVRTSDSTQLWSESFDRPLDDIFAVQDEIAGAVVAQLKIKLLGAVPKVRKTDPEAYALFLQALQLDRQFTQAGMEQSIALYQRALSIDPTYTAAWNGLAGVYSNQAYLGLGPRSADEGFRLAREAVNKALAIDPDYAPAHAHLGWIAMAYDDDLAAAARHLEHALVLDSANPYVISFTAELALNLGHLSTAIELLEYVAARDPVNPGGHGDLAFEYYVAGRLEDAIVSGRSVLALAPDNIGVHYRIGVALLLKADGPAALKEIQAEPDEAWRLTGLALAYHALGKKAESNAALAELIRKHEKSWSSSIAWVLAYRGEAEAAFVWMDKAVANHDTGVVHFPIEPLLANLHNDPRWLPFLHKLGKTPEQLAAIKFEVKLPQ
jgi:TolB-like protein